MVSVHTLRNPVDPLVAPRGPGRPSLYPWDAWMGRLAAGETLTLVRGTDFACAASVMQQQVLNAARRRELVLRTFKLNARTLLVSGRPTRSKYPWNEWLCGRRVVLVAGQHFTVEMRTMRQQVINAALRRGQKVTTKIDGVYLVITPRAKTTAQLSAEAEQRQAELDRVEDDQGEAYGDLEGA